MKTSREILIGIACLSVVVYCFCATIGIRQLGPESGQQWLVGDTAPTRPHPSYEFDDSFREYFGEQRVANIKAALEVAALRGMTDREAMLGFATREYRVRYDLR